MNRTPRRVVVVLAAALVFSTAGCGDSDEAADDETTTTRAGSDDTSSDDTTDDTAGDTTTDDTDDGGTEAAECVQDPERISGSTTVIWTADSESEHATDEATEETTMLLQADGSLDPSTLTVGVGEVFVFGLAEGVEEISVVQVGCDGGQTIYSGPALAGVYVTAPGTYPILGGLDGNEVGTVTVE